MYFNESITVSKVLENFGSSLFQNSSKHKDFPVLKGLEGEQSE